MNTTDHHKLEFRFFTLAAVIAALVAASPRAQAQDEPRNGQLLPDIYVTASRLGGAGIVGSSTTVITAQEIERAPQSTLADMLSREAGIQTSSLFGGVNGAGTTVDMRGFGIAGPSNTLVLINGRRLNDWDLTGTDLSSIALNSIERIEITRGNSGAVLYGDGAVGGVINIVTKTGQGLAPSARIEGGYGSFRQGEGNISANTSSGPFTAAAYGNAIHSDGYRTNNQLNRYNGVGELRYTGEQGSAFFNVSGDDLRLRTPGTRNIIPPSVNELESDRRGTSTPFDFGDKQSVNLTTGFTRDLWNGAELIMDGGARRKTTQFGNFFTNGTPFAFNDTTLTTLSLTPRLRINENLFGLPTKILTGFDFYDTDYSSDRSQFESAVPRHNYRLGQHSIAGYWQQTVALFPSTDVSAGFRIQRHSVFARDNFNPAAPNAGLAVQGLPLDTAQTNRAFHVGFEHRFNEYLAIFGRIAQSFRVPNVDERVGQAPFNFFSPTPTNFDLRTQKSHDIEGGVRIRAGQVELQSTIYDMQLTDELHFNPITLANVNLDPTRRYGVENTATWRMTDAVRLKGSATYTRAIFREGIFAGHDVPVVSRWTGSVGLSWDIWKKQLVFDGVVRYAGKRFLDEDEANVGTYVIPSNTLVDVKLGGEIEKFFWSVSIQNLFDRRYFDYGLDISSPGFPFFAFYPQPGRVIMAKAGVNF